MTPHERQAQIGLLHLEQATLDLLASAGHPMSGTRVAELLGIDKAPDPAVDWVTDEMGPGHLARYVLRRLRRQRLVRRVQGGWVRVTPRSSS